MILIFHQPRQCVADSLILHSGTQNHTEHGRIVHGCLRSHLTNILLIGSAPMVRDVDGDVKGPAKCDIWDGQSYKLCMARWHREEGKM